MGAYLTQTDTQNPLLVEVYDSNHNGVEDTEMVYATKPIGTLMAKTFLIEYAVDKNKDGIFESNEITINPVVLSSFSQSPTS